MNNRALSRNMAFNTLYQVLLYAVPFITTPYLSRVLGAEAIGRYSFAQSIVSYFVLAATLGTTLYGQRRIAALRGDDTGRRQTFCEIALLRAVTVTVAFVIYAVTILPRCVDARLYLIAAIELVAVAADISWYYQGEEQFGVITLCSGLCKIGSAALIFLLVHTPSDLGSYVGIYCGTILLGNLVQWFYLPRILPRTHLTRAKYDLLRHLRPAFSLFVAQVAMQVYTVLDKTMIGVITQSEAQNGYYEQAQRVIRVLTALTTSIGTVMASRVAILWHENRQEEIRDLIESSLQITCAVGLPLVTGLWIIASRFVPIFFGDGYDAVVTLLRVLVLLIVIVGISNVTGIQYLASIGQEWQMTRSVMVGAVVNCVLNAIMIPRYQAVGAAVASVIAEICVTGVQLYAVRRALPVRLVLRAIGHYILPVAGMTLIAYGLERIAPQGILGLVVIIVPSAIVYGAVLFCRKDEALGFVLNREW